MTGTFINVFAVIVGGSFGILFGSRLTDKVRNTVMAGLGMFTLFIAMKMAFTSQNEILILLSLLAGGLLGEWWGIEDAIKSLGAALEVRFAKGMQSPEAAADEEPGEDSSLRFVRGFLTASLLFCVGPMTILGSIQDGLTGDYELLAIKSVLDGFAAMAFASTFGIGVLFSALIILVYQGGISLLAAQIEVFMTEPMMAEMSAVGGVMLMGLVFSSMLQIKSIRVGNFLPALVIAPFLVWALAALNISF